MVRVIGDGKHGFRAPRRARALAAGASGTDGEPRESAAVRGRAHRSDVSTLSLFLIGGVALSGLGLLTTTPLLSGWFVNAPRAEWSPQLWVFEVIWTLGYLADAVAGWLLWRRHRGNAVSGLAVACYFLQVAFQVLWLLGFAAQALVHGSLVGVALVLVVALDFVTWAAAAAAWRVHRGAAVILYTLLAWELFGTVLSAADTALRAV